LTAGEYEEEWKEAKQQADEVLAEIEEEGALEAKGAAEENKEQPPEEKVLVQLLPGLASQTVC
jgi:F0F1-type ATP synthase membrane subunit b/b'